MCCYQRAPHQHVSSICAANTKTMRAWTLVVLTFMGDKINTWRRRERECGPGHGSGEEDNLGWRQLEAQICSHRLAFSNGRYHYYKETVKRFGSDAAALADLYRCIIQSLQPGCVTARHRKCSRHAAKNGPCGAAHHPIQNVYVSVAQIQVNTLWSIII